MPGFYSKGMLPASPIMEAFSQNDSPPSRRGHQRKRSQPFWIQLPDIHPTKVLFVKDKLPDGIIIPSVAISPSLNMSRPSAKTTISLASEYLQVMVYKALFTISSYAFHAQEWSNLARDDVFHLHKPLPLVSYLVGWFVGSVYSSP
jgi:hypothetical protein